MTVCGKCYEVCNEEEVQAALREGKGYIHKCGRIFFYAKGNNRWDTR